MLHPTVSPAGLTKLLPRFLSRFFAFPSIYQALLIERKLQAGLQAARSHGESAEWSRCSRWFVETWITSRQESSDKATSDYHSREKSRNVILTFSFQRNLKNTGRLKNNFFLRTFHFWYKTSELVLEEHCRGFFDAFFLSFMSLFVEDFSFFTYRA